MTDDIQKLRKETGAGIMDVKNALLEAKGDYQNAKDVLRKRGAAIALKKMAREAKEGVIVSYIHSGGKVGVLLKLYCETDFVARTQEFQDLARDIAMHVAAMDPSYISREDIPKDVLDKEKEIYKEQIKDSGKSADITSKIIDGKIDRFVSEVSLLGQVFIKDQDKTIAKLVEEGVTKLGENIQVGEFVRYEL